MCGLHTARGPLEGGYSCERLEQRSSKRKEETETVWLPSSEEGPGAESAPGPMRFSMSVSTGSSTALRVLPAALRRESMHLTYNNKFPIAPCEAL